MKQRRRRAADDGVRILRLEPAAQPTEDAHRWFRSENDAPMKWTRWKSALVVLVVPTLIGLAEGAQVYVGLGARGRPGIPWSRALTSTMPSWYVLALLAGIFGSRRWIAAQLGASGGRSRSASKAAAARVNGQRGGRPRKLAAG